MRDLELLIDMDSSLEEEALRELSVLEGRIEDELRPPSKHEDVVLTISAGAGGSEAQVWVEMLLEMYLSWCERQDWEIEMLSSDEGDPKGLRSVSVRISGLDAESMLAPETGVHRLSRISEFGDGERHTSFASVIVDELVDVGEVSVRDEDLDVSTYGPSGPGGQHANKSETGVRMRHVPTGLRVRCQAERSQHANRTLAKRLLEGKLKNLMEERTQEVAQSKRASAGQASFGNRKRSYVLSPYQLVKDHETHVESSDADGVLSGDLNEFIEAGRDFVVVPSSH